MDIEESVDRLYAATQESIRDREKLQRIIEEVRVNSDAIKVSVVKKWEQESEKEFTRALKEFGHGNDTV